MLKAFLKKALPHAIAVAIFALISLIYFSPAIDGYVVKQGDISKHRGLSKEIADYREFKGEEVLWTNSLFSGMAATQISVHYKNDFFKHIDKVITLGLPHPAGYLFMYMLGFYILLIVLKANPWIAVAGAIAYGFSSYFFIIMSAGHNTKAHAISYMAPALAGFLLIFNNRKYLLGGSIFALFMALLLRSNHIQIAYYLALIMFAIFIWYAVRYIKEKEYKVFGKSILSSIAGGLLALLVASPVLYATYEYAPYTMRGGNNLTVNPDGSVKEKESGLDLDYITLWSYGHQESWSLMIPNVKGGYSGPIAYDEGAMEVLEKTDLTPEEQNEVSRNYLYWGNQRFTSGPVYIGAIVCYLFLMALIFVPGGLKWSLLGVSLLALILAWGNNAMAFTEFFVDNVPLYSKFRAVTMALVVLELTFPLLAFIWLVRLIRKKDDFKEKFKFFGQHVSKLSKNQIFMISSGTLVFILILFLAAPGAFFSFTSNTENERLDINKNVELIQMQIAQNPDMVPPEMKNDEAALQQAIYSQAEQIKTNYLQSKPKLEEFRQAYFKKDVLRSLVFILLAIVLVYIFINKRYDYRYLVAGLTVLILADMWPVATRYLNNDPPEQGADEYKHWQLQGEKNAPVFATPADMAILNHESEANVEIESTRKQLESQFPDPYDNPKAWGEKIAFAALGFNTNYRVLDMENGLTDDGVSPYFHKSVGGYHPAKFQRYQDLIEFHLHRQRSMALNPQGLPQLNVLNMLNTKYIIVNSKSSKILDINDPSTYTNEYGVIYNPEAYGNAWFIKGYTIAETQDEEILGLKNFNTHDSAIIGNDFKDKVSSWDPRYDPDATIELTSYAPNHLMYEVNGLDSEQIAVFSEIYYPKGWKAYVDGKQTDIFRANYVLRAIRVPAGTKKVELRYELGSYKWTTTLSVVSGIIILLVLILSIYLSYRRKPEATE